MRKYISIIASIIFVVLFASCGGDSGGGGGTPPPGPTPTPDPPTSATLLTPVNNENCETGTNISATQATVSFTWAAGQNTDSYELKVSQLGGSSQTKSGISGSSTTVTLQRGYQYSWQVISKATGTNETAQSPTWKFYLAGDGVENYAPFPTELVSPASGATVSVSEDGKISLSWSGEDPDGDALTYTVYMDQVDGLQEPVASSITETSLEVSAEKDTVYYWRVKSSDGENSAFSQIYAFRTDS